MMFESVFNSNVSLYIFLVKSINYALLNTLKYLKNVFFELQQLVFRIWFCCRSVIYKEQVRLNQAASNALMARLEAQREICDAAEKDLHKKYKQRDDIEKH